MTVLELRGLSVTDLGAPPLRGLDLSLSAGERLIVFGSSGSGKRALLKAAAGVLRPESGSVRVEAEGRPCPVGYAPRDGGLLSNETLLRNAVLPLLYHRRMSRGEAERRALALFEELGARESAGLRPAAAPSGARRMAQLARALLVEPKLYLLESPLDDLDAAGGVAVRLVMERVRADAGAAAVVATGRLGPFYLGWGTRFLMLQGGRARHYEGREALLADEDPEVRVYTR